MSERNKHIAFKLMPDGDIRAFQDNTADKRGVSELNITNPRNVAPTIISSTPPKIIEYET